MNDHVTPDPDAEPAVREDTGGWISGPSATSPNFGEDSRLDRAREVLEGCPPSPYSPAVSPGERAFWVERACSALRDCLDLIAEHDHLHGSLDGCGRDVQPPELPPRLDGSLPAGDPRVNSARVLLAEEHAPLVMTPGDVRTLLARHQRAVALLLAVVDGAAL